MPQSERENIRQTRRLQSYGKHQGPHCAADDRGRRAGRTADARQDDHRTHIGQHGHRAGHRGDRQGLSRGDRDERSGVDRTAEDHPLLRCEGDSDARRGGDRRGDPPGAEKSRRRSRQVFHARPVRQRQQLPGPLPVDGAGDLAADRRQHRLPCLRDRDFGDADGSFAFPQGDEARHQGRLRTADPRPLHSGAQEHGGGHRARHLRSVADRRAGDDRERGGDLHGPGNHPQGGDLRRHVERRGDAGGGAYGAEDRAGQYRRGFPRPGREVLEHDDVRRVLGLILRPEY